MTHLGIRITSLVDGRLALDALDRAHAHLATCADCRAQLAAEHLMKSRLTELAAPPPRDDLIVRLFELSAPGGPVPPRPGHVPGMPRPQPLLMPGRSTFGPSDARPTGRPLAPLRVSSRPAGRPGVRRVPGPARVRLTAALFGTLCLVGAGVGATQVSSARLPVPRVTPNQMVLEHAATFRTAMFSGIQERKSPAGR